MDSCKRLRNGLLTALWAGLGLASLPGMSLAADGAGPRAPAAPLPGFGVKAAAVGMVGLGGPVNEMIGPKIRVKDFDKAIEYYEAVFDMVLAGRINRNEVALSFRNAQPTPRQPAGTIPEPILILQLDPEFVAYTSNVPVFAVRVADVAAVRKKAADMGLPMSGAGAFAIGRDPSGNAVEAIASASYLSIPAR